MTKFQLLGDLCSTHLARIRALRKDPPWRKIEDNDQWLAYVHCSDAVTLEVFDRKSGLEMTAWLDANWSITEYQLQRNGQLLDEEQYDATLVARIVAQAGRLRDMAQA